MFSERVAYSSGSCHEQFPCGFQLRCIPQFVRCASCELLLKFGVWADLSCQQVLDDFAVYVRQAEIPPLMPEGQVFMVDAQAMQHGRIQVVDVNRSWTDQVR